MSTDKDFADIMASLGKYIESRERELDEQNSRLLEKGRAAFEAALAERISEYKRTEESGINKRQTQEARTRAGKLVRRVLARILPSPK